MPAGAISITRSRRAAPNVSMHRSQRTGLETWATRRSQHLGAGLDDLAVPVGDVADHRVGAPSGPGRARPGAHAGGHVRGVERAGHLQRRSARRLRRRVGARASSCSSVPAATIWPAPLMLAGGQAVFAQLGPDHVGVAAEHGDHAGGGDRGGAAIARPAPRTKVIASVGAEHAGRGGGGDLADAVSGDHADRAVDGLRRGPGNSAPAMTRPAATSSGWATAVSRISSASALVP